MELNSLGLANKTRQAYTLARRMLGFGIHLLVTTFNQCSAFDAASAVLNTAILPYCFIVWYEYDWSLKRFAQTLKIVRKLSKKSHEKKQILNNYFLQNTGCWISLKTNFLCDEP